VDVVVLRICFASLLLSFLSSQATDYDKDVRIIAISDICNELEKDIKIDAHLEKR
jgi:hypothetical protein